MRQLKISKSKIVLHLPYLVHQYRISIKIIRFGENLSMGWDLP